MAADLQDPPELIPEMVSCWRSGARVVWAVRGAREGIPWLHLMFSRFFYWITSRLNIVRLPPSGADFALLDRTVTQAVLRSIRGNVSIGTLVAWTGFPSVSIPYTKQRRFAGRSHWTIGNKVTALIDAVVGYSYAPMRIISLSGLVTAALGSAYALFLIVRAILFPISIQGWSSLMVVVLMIGGVQMITLGVLGEYIWRTLEAARDRPLYFVESQVGFEEHTD